MARNPKTVAATAVGLVRRSRRSLLLGTALQATTLIALAFPLVSAGPAPNAQPQGGRVVGGQAAISATPTATTIQQSSARAAIDWRSFDIGSQQSVTFVQPSGSSIALNRVISPNPSQIAGRLSANGQLVIVNQSGVAFTGSAQVDVNGLVVSTANLATRNFMAGRLVFDQAGKPGASIVNQGAITIRQAGLAALVAPSVANSGVITAKLGNIVLGGATTHTVDLYGDGMMAVALTGKVNQVPLGPDGKPVAALVVNTGTLRAAGGSITLTAAAADGIVQDLVRAGGKISVSDAAGAGGSIALRGIGGSLVIDGDLAATGRTGGQIEAVATNAVTLAPTARVNASGRQGGGVIALGTTLARAKGGPSVAPTLTAASVVIAPGARVSADATRKGHGGTATVLSTANTNMAGTITAKGGPKGGDGGFVEVSGGSGYSLTGIIDVGAAHGAAGTILIDPNVLDIVGATDVDNVFTLDASGGGTVAAGNAGLGVEPALLGANVFTGLSGNVLLAAQSQINIQAPITSSTLTSLSFQAPTVASTSLGAVSLSSPGARLTISANTLTLGAAISAPTIEIAPISGAQTVTGALALNINAGTLLLLGAATAPGASAPTTTASSLAFDASDIGSPTQLSVGTGTLDLRSLGAITQTNSLVLAAGALQIAAGGAVSLPLAGNAVSTLVRSSSTGDLALTNGSALSVTGAVVDSASIALSATALTAGGAISAPSVSLTASAAAGTLAIGGTVSATASIALAAGGAITETGLLSGGGALTAVSSNGAVSLNSQNAVGTLGASSAATGFSLATAGDLATTGSISATTTLSLASSGSLAIGGVLNAPNIVLSGANAVTETGSLTGGGTLSVSSVSTGGTAALTGSNTIAVLATSSAANGIALTDTSSLVTAGSITTGGTLSLTGAPTLTLAGALSAPGMVLSAGTLLNLNTGLTNASATSVVLQAPTISANSSGAIALGGASDATARLSVAADTLSLGGAVYAPTIEIAPFTSGAAQTFTAAEATEIAAGIANSQIGTLTLLRLGAAAVGATASSLQFDVSGAVANFAANTLDLHSLTGGITQSATDLPLSATQLLISSAGTVSLAAPTNAFTTLAGSSSSGGLSLLDGGPLSIAGQIVDSGTLSTIGVTATALTVATSGTIAAPNVALTANAGSLTIGGAGLINAGNSIALSASGAVAGGGSLAGGGTLSAVSTGGSVALTGANAIAVLSGGSAATGFSFADTTGFSTAGAIGGTAVSLASGGTLSIGAPVSGSTSIALSAPGAIAQTGSGSLIGGGTLSALSSGGAVTLNGTANAISVLAAGSAGAAGGFTFVDSNGFATAGTVAGGAVFGAGATLTAASGTLTIGGVVNAPASGTIALSGPAGIVQTGSGALTGGGALTAASATGAVTLNGTANAVSVLAAGSAGAAGGFTLVDSTGFATTGPVSSGTVSGAGVTLTASSGTLAINSAVSATSAGTIALSGASGITETGSLIGGGALVATSSGGAVTLTNANAIATLGSGSASTGFAFTDSAGFTVPGTISAGTTLALTASAGAINATGSLAATGAGGLAALSAPTVSVAGTVSASGTGGEITIAANGFSLASTGTLIAPTGAVAIVPLTPGETISVGGAAAANTLTIDLASLASQINAGALFLGSLDGSTVSNTASIAISGILNRGTGLLGLFSSGAISESGGAVTAGALIGGAGGDIALGGSNAISVIGQAAPFSFGGRVSAAGLTAGGNATIVSGSALTVLGSVGLQGGQTVVGPTSVSLSTTSGAITLYGPVGNCGTGGAAVAAAGVLTIGTTVNGNPFTQGVWSSGTTAISGSAIALNEGGVIGASILVGAPALPTGGTLSVSGGTLASSGNTTLGTLTLGSGLVDVGGTLSAATIALNGGTIDAGALSATTQTYGAGAWSLNVATGTVGLPGALGSGQTIVAGQDAVFSGGSSPFSDTGGTLIAGGDVTVSAGAVTLSGGLIAAAGTLAVTGTSISQSGGTVGGTTVQIAATTGSAIQSGGTLLGGTITVQAPSGENDFSATQGVAVTVGAGAASSFACVCSGGTIAISVAGPETPTGTGAGTASGAASGTPNSISIGGATVTIDHALLANTVTLSATGAIVETAASAYGPSPVVITAGTLTGSGASVSLGTLAIAGAETISNPNSIAVLGNLAATAGSLSLTNVGGLALRAGATVQASAASAASVTLATTGSLSIPGTATVAATGTASGGNVLLVANAALSTGGTAGSISIGGAASANGGTLSLMSETGITASGVLTAHVLTGRAGAAGGDTDLPSNFRTPSVGAVALTNATNKFDIVGTLLATGAITLDDAPTAGVTLIGPVVAGYGGAAGDVFVSSAGGAGSLAVNGSVASGATTGNVTLLAAGALSVGATTALAGATTPVIYATGLASLQAGDVSLATTGAFTLTSGLINAGSVSIAAAGGKTIGGGTIVSAGGGIDLSGGAPGGGATALAMTGGTVSATGAAANVTIGALTLSGGTISANGGFTAGLVAQSGGSVVTLGTIFTTGLFQSAGLLAAGSDLTIGGGTGVAGFAGSTGPTSDFTQTGGTLLATGNISLWSAGAQNTLVAPGTLVAQLGGVIAAGGTVGLTADSGILAAGTISGGSGVTLLATSGNAIQTAGLVAGGLAATQGVVVQAPGGTVQFGNFGGAGSVGAASGASLATLQCGGACIVPLGTIPGALTAPPLAAPGAATAASATTAVPVALVGGSIDLPRNVLASTLQLYARTNITEDGAATINAGSLTGSAGVPVASGWTLPTGLRTLGWTQTTLGWTTATAGSAMLGGIPALKGGGLEILASGGTGAVLLSNANTIATLGDFAATQNVSLADVSALTIGGTVQAGYGAGVGTAPAGVTIAVAAPITLSGAVLAGVSATVASASTSGGDVTLISNSHLASGGTTGTITIGGTLTAYGTSAQGGGTLALYSETSIADSGGAGLLTANVLTGRAGLLAADTTQLPSNFQVDSSGSVSLVNPANAIDTLDAFLATADFMLKDAPTNAAATLTIVSTNTVTPIAAVAAGYGTIGTTSDLVITLASGNLAIEGWLGASRNTILAAASGNIVIGTTGASAIQSVISANGAESLSAAGGTIAVANGLLEAAAITLSAPTKIIGTAGLTGSGILVTTGGGTLDGITLNNGTTNSFGTTTLNGATLSATGGTLHNDITLDTTTQNGGVVSANGDIVGATIIVGGTTLDANLTQTAGAIIAGQTVNVAGLVTQSGGAITAGETVTIGTLQQSGGMIVADGGASADVIIGTGSGQAGIALSQATSGSVSVAGTIVSAGNISLWDTTLPGGTVQISGVIVAGGTVGLTSNVGIMQTGGTIAGAQGVALLTLTGDARQAPNALVASGAGTGQGISIQAPQGAETFSNFGRNALTVTAIGAAATWTIECPACAIPLPHSFPPIAIPVATGGGTTGSIDLSAATGLVPVTLVGQSITIQNAALGTIVSQGVTLRATQASSLGLFASGNISEDPGASIVATTLYGGAGVASGSVLPAGLSALGWTSPAALGGGWITPGAGGVTLGGIPGLTGGAFETAVTAVRLSNANTIATLGGFTTTQDFSLADVAALTVGPATVALPLDRGTTTLALGGTLLAGYAPTAYAGPAGITLAVAGPLTLNAPVLAGVAGTGNTGNATLIANGGLAPVGSTGSTGAITIAAPLAAYGGALALYSQTDIGDAGGVGAITAGVLTGRAGSLASDTTQLPSNFAVNASGSVSLTNATNAVGTLDTFLATAGFGLVDSTGLTIASTNAATPVAAVAGGYGAVFGGNLSIAVAGNLAVDAWLAAQGVGGTGGNLTLAASGGSLTLGTPTLQAAVSATGTAGLRADGAITVANALIEAAGISLAAPTKTIGTATIANSGLLISTGGGTLDGITLSGGGSALNGAILSATGATRNDVVLDATTQNGGVVSANGFIATPGLVQNAGTFIAVGAVSVGAGSGQAGIALSQAASGGVTIAGSLVSGGNVSLWDATGSTVQISGAVLANGTIGLTATGGIMQTGGTIAGAQGVALLALTGAAAQAASGAIVAAGGQGVGIQAPQGAETFSSFGRVAASLAAVSAAGPWSLECPACKVALPASFAAPVVPVPLAARAAGSIDLSPATGLVPVALVGGSVEIQGVTLRASSLGLFASGNIFEDAGASIVATTLYGSAGVASGSTLPAGLTALGWTSPAALGGGWTTPGAGSATLGGIPALTGGAFETAAGQGTNAVVLSNANSIATLGGFTTTQDFSLADVAALTVGPATVALPLDRGTATLALGGTMLAGYAPAAYAGPASITLAVAGPLTLNAPVLAGTAGGNAGDVVLLANGNLAGGGTTGTITIAAPLAAYGGALALYAQTNVADAGGVGAITANVLTGRAGSLAADTTQLPSNFTVNASGSVSLTNATNAVGTLDNFLATAGFGLVDSTGLTIVSTNAATPVAAVAAGYGNVFGGNLSIAATGNIVVDAWLAAQGGNLTLAAAGGGVTLGTPSLQAAVSATGTAGLRADGAITAANALIEAAGISLAAPTKTIGTAGLANSGLLISTGGGTLDGIALSGGTSTLNGAVLSAAGATQNDVVLDATTQNGGVVSANGFIVTPSLVQNAGTFIAVGSIAIATLLNQTSGAIEAGGAITLGQGTGQAGAALSQAGVGTVALGGSLIAGGDISLWDATGSTVQISGAVLANGRIGLTASGGVSQTGGTIAGAHGVALLATNGNATQIAASSIVAGGTAAGQGVSIEAPRGTENFTSFGRSGIVVASIAAGPWTLECPACDVPLPAAFAAPTAAVPLATETWSGAPDVSLATGRVPVLLVGASIDLPANVLADTLSLYASGAITEETAATVTANLLTGRAGLVATDGSEAQYGFTPATPTVTTSGSVALGSAGNAIDTLGNFLATAGFALADAPTNAANTLTIINGTSVAAVSGGYGGAFGGNLSIAVAGNIAVDAWLGAQAVNGAGGNLTLTATSGGIVIGATGLQSVLAATLAANLHADNAITVADGLINAGAVTLDARSKTIGASGVANSGVVVATGAASGDGITLSGGISTLNGATLSATGAARNDVSLDAVIQTGGVVSANGVITAASLAQSGAAVLAGGGVTIAGALNQTSGAILAGGNVVVGSGSGVAGLAQSAAGAGAAIIGGTIVADGAVSLWDASAGGARISGLVLANGVVGLTASNGIAQTGGTIAGGAGVALLAQSGAATQSGGAIVAAGAAAGQGVAVQAPAGLENFSSFGRDAVTLASITPAGSWAIECPSCTVPLPASFVAPAVAVPVASGAARAGSIDLAASTGLIPVALLGGTIEIQSGALRASSLGLYASGAIGEDSGGVIIASTLNGSAGIASASALPAGVTALGWTAASQLGGGWAALSTSNAILGGIPALTGGGSETAAGGGALLLSNANSIAALGAFATTGTFTLADATALTIGPVAAAALPLNARGGAAIALGGAVQAIQGATIAVAGGLTVNGAINASAIELVADRFLSSAATTASAAGSISVAGTLTGTTVGLYSETSVADAGGSGVISAGTLTGRAGALTADATQLPANFTAVNTAGSLSLTNAANAIGTLDTFLATAGITLVDAPAGGGSLLAILSPTASRVAAVDAGYGGVFGGNLAITVAGNLVVDGWLGAQSGNGQSGGGQGGNLTLAAATGMTIGSSAVQSVLAAANTASLHAGSALTIGNGLINAAAIVLDAPSKTVGTVGVANSGVLVSTGGGAVDGIALSGGASALNGATISATGASGNDVVLDAATIAGGVVSANGGLSAANLISANDVLAIGGAVAVGGDVTQSGGAITAGGNLAAADLTSVNANIAAGGAIAVAGNIGQTGGATSAGGALTAASLTNTSGSIAIGGGVAVTGGFGETGGAISAGGGLAAASLTSANGNIAIGGTIVVAGALSQTDGAIFAAGGVRANSLSQSGGSLIAGGDIVVGGGGGTAGLATSIASQGSVAQSGTTGLIAAGGNISLWDTSGTVALAGAILAGGTVGLTTQGGFTQGATGDPGAIIAGVKGVALLANAGDAAQISGVVAAGAAGGQGISIQSPHGVESFTNFASATAASIRGGGLAAGGAIAIAASGPWSLECPACAVALPAGFAAPAAAVPIVGAAAGAGATIGGAFATANAAVDPATGVPVTLVGDSIAINANLRASTLQLYARRDIVEAPGVSVAAALLTGSAGVPSSGALPAGLAALGWTQAALQWAPSSGSALLGYDLATQTPPVANNTAQNLNAIAALGDFSVTQTLVLHDAAPLTIGAATAGVALNLSGATAAAFDGNLTAGPQSGGGTIDIASDNAITQTGSATWSASRIVVTAQTGDLTLASGGRLTVATDGPANIPGRYPRPTSLTSPYDPSTNTSYGVSFSAVAGSILDQSGIAIVPLAGQTNPLARFILGTTDFRTPNSGVINLTGGVTTYQPETLANAATVILYLSNGTGIGSVNVGALEVFYTGTDNRPSTPFISSTLLNAQGVSVTGSVAASLATIGLGVPGGPVTFKPNHSITLNGCVIASVNCTLLTTELLPAGSPLRDFTFSTLNDSDDDPDFLLPSVSDQDY